jgi:DNA-directed RNA polymerase subunit RPC12/RpoP
MSSGEHDYGMFPVTDTYICKSCKAIVDVPVGIHGETFSKEEALLKKGMLGFNLDFYVCPNCKADTNLIDWNKSKRPCPKCDGKMEKDLHGEIIMWD